MKVRIEMAEKMDIVKVFRILLDGGHIASIEHIQKKTKFYVSYNYEKVGHISQKQLEDLCENGIIESYNHFGHNQRTDDSGNIVTLYYLAEQYKRDGIRLGLRPLLILRP